MIKKKTNDAENKISGIAAAPGISIARAYLYSRERLEVSDATIDDIDEAISHLNEAVAKSKKELHKILNIANEKMGEKRAAIFEAQVMILDDPVLLDTLYKRIRNERKLPEYIVNDEITKYQELMNASEEFYMKERSHDIEDIKNRIIRNLQKKRISARVDDDVVLITSNLSPADTLLFSKNNVKGFVTDFGGLTSHAAIVARSLRIPAVVGAHDASSKIQNNDIIIVDGFHGSVIINPDDKQLEYYKKKIEKLSKIDLELAGLRDEPAITLDGREIILRGNIDLVEEIETLVSNGAKGIGLLRTEQIFSGLESFPDELEQTAVYSEIAEKVYPEYVVIRAFDVGGDKYLPHDIKEPNPFLGWRGIRFLLDNREIFKTQIRAVLQAGVHKNVKFMLPMVSSIIEVKNTKKLIQECIEELRKEKLKFDAHMNIGIMVEIPSAAVLADEFAKEVSFLSIGTNDLIQFLLAVDRGNEIVSTHYQEFHPAVIRTISYIIRHGKKHDAMVSLCGEMGADAQAIPLLVGMGLDSISAAPSAIPFLKKVIRNLNYSDTKQLADDCLCLPTMIEVRNRIDKFFKDHLIQQMKNLI